MKAARAVAPANVARMKGLRRIGPFLRKRLLLMVGLPPFRRGNRIQRLRGSWRHADCAAWAHHCGLAPGSGRRHGCWFGLRSAMMRQFVMSAARTGGPE